MTAATTEPQPGSVYRYALRVDFGKAALRIAPDGQAVVQAEGQVFDAASVKVLAGLGSTMPEWAVPLLIADTAVQHTPDLERGDVFRVAAASVCYGTTLASARLVRRNPVLAMCKAERLRPLLARHPLTEVRLAVAQLLTTAASDQPLFELLASDHEAVRAVVAGNPACPETVAVTLAADEETEVAVAVASTTPHAAALIAACERLPVDEIEEALDDRKFIPDSAWEYLAGHPAPEVRQQVARRYEAPYDLLERLAFDESRDRTSLMARHTLNWKA